MTLNATVCILNCELSSPWPFEDDNVLFVFQISILIHRTVCSNVQMRMYNLKTKPQVFGECFFFLVEERGEERRECTLTGFACG